MTYGTSKRTGLPFKLDRFSKTCYFARTTQGVIVYYNIHSSGSQKRSLKKGALSVPFC
jgi:hypothetical protein